jgi:hypothetical protein
MVPESKEWLKIRSEGVGISYTNARIKVPEHRSGLPPSEKELPERRSGAFRYRKYPYLYT